MAEGGEAPALAAAAGRGASRRYAADIGRLDVVWPASEWAVSLAVAARLDATGVAPALSAFVWRVAWLVLLISIFVSGAALLVFRRSILSRVLALREQMALAAENPGDANSHVVNAKGHDELSALAREFNALVHHIANRFGELDDTRVLQEQARADLESRVREQTAGLRQVNARLEREVAQHRITEGRFRATRDQLEKAVGERTEELRESESRLSDILRISPEAVILIGTDLAIRQFNGGAERIFGYGAAEMKGKPLDLLMPERFRAGHPALIRRFSESPEESRSMDQRQTIFGLRADGSEFPAAASVSKMRFGGEDLFAVILQDMTIYKQAEYQAVAAKEAAEYANRSKSDFLANMSHELRTPLNSIIGFSEMMVTGAFGPMEVPKYREYVGIIQESGEHLLRLINDILDVSKIEAGEMIIDDETTDMRALIEDCLRMVRARANKAGLRLSMAVAPEVAAVVGDALRLKQILLNLLSNAIKFTPQGGTVGVVVTLEEDGGLLLQVSDSGVGMQPDDIPKVLKPFVQARVGAVLTHEGTGLGLSLVKSFAELHGGGIDITSTPGEGTTVNLRLPAARVVAA